MLGNPDVDILTHLNHGHVSKVELVYHDPLGLLLKLNQVPDGDFLL